MLCSIGKRVTIDDVDYYVSVVEDGLIAGWKDKNMKVEIDPLLFSYNFFSSLFLFPPLRMALSKRTCIIHQKGGKGVIFLS